MAQVSQVTIADVDGVRRDVATQTAVVALLQALLGAKYNAVLPTLNPGDQSIPQCDVNGIPYSHQGDLSAATDSVQTQGVSGVLWDAAGNQMTVKTANGVASSSGVNAIVAAVTSKKIRVLSYSLQAANANASVVTANFQDDTGTPVVLSQNWDFNAREGVSKGRGASDHFYFQSSLGKALKLNLSGELAVNWEITYVEAA